MHYLKDKGSKTLLKGGRVRKCTTWEVRAQRRTRKKIGLQNALPKRWWLKSTLKKEVGLKGALKGGRIRKRTTQEVMVKHWYVNDESNAWWSICMYTYLRNIGPSFLHEVFLFLKVWVLVVNFNDLFALDY